MNNFQGATTTTVTETHVQTNIRWDPSYIKTIPGMLKIGAIVVDLIGFICIVSTGAFHSTTTGEWYDFVAMTGFWVSGTLLLFYLLHVIEKFHVIPWMAIEMGFCGVWSFFFFTCSLDTALNATGIPGFGAAAFFGFVAVLIYGYDAFLKFKGYRAGQIAQGQQTVQQTTTSPGVTSPGFE